MLERWEPPDLTVITGASGWLGRALLGRLLHDGRRVRVLVSSSQEAGSCAALPAGDVIVGDIAKADTSLRLLHCVRSAGASTVDVIHTAGVIHPRRVSDFTAINANGTRHLAEAAAARGVRRFVHVSSNSPFGTNPQPTDRFRAEEPYHPYLGYGRSKMEAELAVFEMIERGLDATIVRPPWFYGPHQPARQTEFLKLIRRGRFPIVGDGSQRRSMVYIGNLVDGILAAELTPAARGKGWWIADERPYALVEIVETVSRALVDEGFDVHAASVRLPAIASRCAELADRVLQRAGLYEQRLHVLGELGHTIACDIGASRGGLGYEPSVELYEGMRRSIRWCVEQGVEL